MIPARNATSPRSFRDGITEAEGAVKLRGIISDGGDFAAAAEKEPADAVIERGEERGLSIVVERRIAGEAGVRHGGVIDGAGWSAIARIGPIDGGIADDAFSDEGADARSIQHWPRVHEIKIARVARAGNPGNRTAVAAEDAFAADVLQAGFEAHLAGTVDGGRAKRLKRSSIAIAVNAPPSPRKMPDLPLLRLALNATEPTLLMTGTSKPNDRRCRR